MNMKKILLSSISMATLACAMMTTALFSSCSSEEEQTPENQQPVELQIVSAINTRAANAAWTAGDMIGVFALKGGAQDYSNMSYTTSDGSGSFLPSAEDQTIMLPYDGSNYTIAAYYPYTESLKDGSYAINVSSQGDQEAIDLLVAAPVSGVNKMSPVAALDFYHKLVKITITMKPGNGITADQLSGMTVTISGQQTEGTCDIINNGDVVASGPTSDITSVDSRPKVLAISSTTVTSWPQVQHQTSPWRHLPMERPAKLSCCLQLPPMAWCLPSVSLMQEFTHGL